MLDAVTTTIPPFFVLRLDWFSFALACLLVDIGGGYSRRLIILNAHSTAHFSLDLLKATAACFRYKSGDEREEDQA
jgi:hypothetical protein